MQVSIILKDEQISSKIYRYLKWLSIKSQVFEDTQSMLKWFKDNEDAEDTVALINSNVNPNEIPKHIEPLVISDSVDASDSTFVRINGSDQNIVINHVTSHLQSKIIYFALNLNKRKRAIWLSRHGESEFNLSGQIGGDANLSERGWAYARKLPLLVEKSCNGANLTVWTSTLRRTQQTASFLPFQKKLQWKALDELDAGECDGMTYEEIEQKFPDDFKARDDNKYEYRYRGGESYRDIVIRLEPIIMELERQENILIITHQAVLRCLYAYFMNVPQEESPWMSIPLHTLIKLEPGTFETIVTRIKTDIPAVSTYKEKGTSQLGESTTNTSKSRDLISNSNSV